MDLADIMLRGLDQGAGVASRALSFTQQAEQLRRLRELDQYQQEQDRLNYGLRQADDARADQRFAFEQEQAGQRNQQYQQAMGQDQAAQRFNTGRYIQQTGPVGDSNFFQAADFSQMDPRLQSSVLAPMQAQTREQAQAEEERARKGQAWNAMQARRKSRGGSTNDALVDMWEESQLAADAGIPDYAYRETIRQREAQAKAMEQQAAQAAMVQQGAKDLQAVFPRAQPGQAEAAARLRANDFPVGLGNANLSGETRGVPLSQDRDYARLKLVLDDAEDDVQAEREAQGKALASDRPSYVPRIEAARKRAKEARQLMMDHLSGGGQQSPASAAPSPTSAVAPAADPIESVLTELEQRLGRPPTEEEAWQALNGGG